MTREYIINGNKSIAEFMCYSEGYPHETDKYGYSQCLNGYEIQDHINYNRHEDDKDVHQFILEELKFHSSWDWLMIVVEKIESIKDNYQGRFGIHIASNSCHIQSTKFKSNQSIDPPYYFKDYVGGTKIESTWMAVIQFIEWYNLSIKK